MKTHNNAAIKAHLIRGAFYLLLLLAVCAIPFALAQSRSRGTTKRSVANPASNSSMAAKFAAAQPASGAAQATKLSGVHSKAASQSNAGSRLLPYDLRGVPDLPSISQFPQKTSGVRAAHMIRIPRPPKAPQVVLYDQYDNSGANATLSATFTDFPDFDADLADDFVVPAGQTWNVESIDADGVYFNGSGPATDWNVFIYADNAGLPGAQVYGILNQPVSVVGTTFTVNLSPAAVLTEGTYWIEVQANMTFATEGQWGWTDRIVQSNSPAAWQNPGGGFGICQTWGRRGDTCGMDPGVPDQVYRINGTIGGGATPTPTATATATPTATPTCTARATPGPWIAANPYPTTIARYGFAQTATHFYVFGGVSDNTSVNAVNRLDLATGIWESRAPMPFTSEAPTCALMADTGIVYCAQGDTGNGFASYDIATDAWTSLASDPLVTDHYGSASGAFNGKVFVAGGTSSFSSGVEIYDVATNTWSAGTAAPNGYLLAGYQQVGQYLYVVGGWTGGGPNGLTTTTRLNMSSAPGVWENGPVFPLGRADFGLAYDAETNKLFVLGGDLCCDGDFFNSTDKVNELDLSLWPTGDWPRLYPNVPLPVRQSNQAGFYGNGDIWSVGGIDGATMQYLPDVYHRATGGDCVSATPTATATATATPTSTPTPTATAMATATSTPTGSPSCTPIVIEGSIDLTDPTQTDHLNRSGIPQTCPATTTCAIFGDGLLHHYDSYMFTNTTGSRQCVNIDTNSACIGVRFIFTAAYLESFDPNNICTNWIGDSGFSPDPDRAFQVNVDNGQTLIVVVSNVTATGTCPDYTLTIAGLCGGTPTPTPTATASPTASETATPTATATTTATATATPTATAAATASPTPRPTPTPRSAPTPRPRPTPAPRQ
jgi:hypothetical protein